METYHKIETVFNRDTMGTKKLVWGSYRNLTVEYLKNNIWQFTEKVDGTNIRIHWDGHNVEIGGRTDKAQLPAKLVQYLSDKFLSNEAEELFEQVFGEKEVIFFGEGYGAGIQNGEAYSTEQKFMLFDVMIGNNYQNRAIVKEIGSIFGAEVVPMLFEGTLSEGYKFVMSHPKSTIGHAMMEGVVARPKMELQDRCGNRVIVKIKWCDFKEFVKEDNHGTGNS